MEKIFKFFVHFYGLFEDCMTSFNTFHRQYKYFVV